MVSGAVLSTLLSVASPPDLTSQSFDARVGQHLHTLVEFHAPWCTACASFATVLHAVAAELTGDRPDVQFARVDGDAHPDLRTRFRIDEAPSILIFPAGKAADRSLAAHFDGEHQGRISAKAEEAAADVH